MTPQGLPVAVLAGPTAKIKYGRDTDGYNYTKSHIGIDTHLYSQCIVSCCGTESAPLYTTLQVSVNTKQALTHVHLCICACYTV